MQSRKNEAFGLFVEVLSAFLYCGMIFTTVYFAVR